MIAIMDRIKVIDIRETNTYAHFKGQYGTVRNYLYNDKVDKHYYEIELDGGMKIYPFVNEINEVVEIVK